MQLAWALEMTSGMVNDVMSHCNEFKGLLTFARCSTRDFYDEEGQCRMMVDKMVKKTFLSIKVGDRCRVRGDDHVLQTRVSVGDCVKAL